MSTTSTTSTEGRNRALLERIFEGVARGDGSLFVASLAEDATMTITGQYSWARTIRGKPRILRDLYGYVRSRLRERGRTRAFHVLAAGDWVVVEAVGDMVTKEGVPYRNEYCLLYRLAEGLIVEMKEYQDSSLCERVLGPYPAELHAAPE